LDDQSTKVKGQAKETEAIKYLLSKHSNMRLLKRNYLCSQGEIDLIFEEKLSRDETELVFVEVRSSGIDLGGRLVESIAADKKRHILQTARHYLKNYRGFAGSMRFDVLVSEAGKWTYLKEAFSL